jgi:hypothetical protein
MMHSLSLHLSLIGAQYGGGGGVPVGDWILAAGLWDDVGVWRDDQTWID